MNYFLDEKLYDTLLKKTPKIDTIHTTRLLVEARKYYIFKSQVAKYKLTAAPKSLHLADISEAIQENIYQKHMLMIPYSSKKRISVMMAKARNDVALELSRDISLTSV